MAKIKAVVLKAPGTNCDAEMAHGLKLAGADSETVYLKELEKNPGLLKRYAVCVFPGGFSYGDYLGSGKSFALISESAFGGELNEFAQSGRFILGVCNGFQILTKIGLLPGDGSSVSLAANIGGQFMCRWVPVALEKKSVLYKQFKVQSSTFNEPGELPIAHGEGRFAAASASELKRLEREGLVFLRYGAENPNGSQARIAGITNAKGNVIGLMPHPERFVNSSQHYDSASKRDITPWGLEFLKGIVKCAEYSA